MGERSANLNNACSVSDIRYYLCEHIPQILAPLLLELLVFFRLAIYILPSRIVLSCRRINVQHGMSWWSQRIVMSRWYGQ